MDSFWRDAPTWGLLVVGIIGARIAIRTLWNIREQTRALINSERAWIMVDVDPVPGVGGLMDGHRMQMGVGPVESESTTFGARIVCRNDGKVPAWITEKRACLDIVEALPDKPDWSRTTPVQLTLEPISVGQTSKQDETLTCKRGRALGKMVILYGVVTYRDPFGHNRTTTFGYKVRDDGVLERLSLPTYNENT
jgi:hypothetical protein